MKRFEKYSGLSALGSSSSFMTSSIGDDEDVAVEDSSEAERRRIPSLIPDVHIPRVRLRQIRQRLQNQLELERASTAHSSTSLEATEISQPSVPTTPRVSIKRWIIIPILLIVILAMIIAIAVVFRKF